MYNNTTDHRPTNCDYEPVNTTGSIQPFGALIVLSNDDIVNWSKNLAEVLAVSPKSHFKFSDLFDPRSCGGLNSALDVPVNDGALRPVLLATHSGRQCNVFPHRTNGRTILEFEPPANGTELENRRLEYELAALVSLIDGVETTREVCDSAVHAVREMSGYDRVMIYKFHEDMHGEVIAESAANRLESWLGLHYPASDIPQPARRIFLLNKIRLIPDVNYVPVPIAGPGNATLDLGRSLLRSASPIHIEYLKNMGVSASLTISIKIGDVLWGLIACHHYGGPRLPTFTQRQMYAMAGDYISAAIRRRIEDENISERARVRGVETILRRRMESLPEITEALANGEVNALSLMTDHSNGLAVHYGTAWAVQGATPTITQLEELRAWLEPACDEKPFATDSLSKGFEPAQNYSRIASGLLAITVPNAANAIVLWFKPETLQTLNWGGDPTKQVVSGSERLHPRNSFAVWKETVRCTSVPWKRWEIETALRLRDTIIAARLQYQYERERAARAEAEQAKRTREEFMAVISHDLRNPLSSVMLNMALLNRVSGEIQSPTTKSIFASMDRATKQMKWLIDGLLDIAQADSGTMEMKFAHCSVQKLIEHSTNVISPIADAKRVTLQLPALERAEFVKCDEQRMLQVLSNILGNAIKFTPEGGQVALAVEVSATLVTFRIFDTGPGIPPDQLPYIFDRFWRGRDLSVTGVGLGLSIVKAIIAAHEGNVRAENGPEGGACFSFTLEKA